LELPPHDQQKERSVKETAQRMTIQKERRCLTQESPLEQKREELGHN